MAFSGAKRRTRLIPLFEDTRSKREGVNHFVIKELYRQILPTLIANLEGIFKHNNTLKHTIYLIRDTLAKIEIEVIATLFP